MGSVCRYPWAWYLVHHSCILHQRSTIPLLTRISMPMLTREGCMRLMRSTSLRNSKLSADLSWHVHLPTRTVAKGCLIIGMLVGRRRKRSDTRSASPHQDLRHTHVHADVPCRSANIPRTLLRLRRRYVLLRQAPALSTSHPASPTRRLHPQQPACPISLITSLAAPDAFLYLQDVVMMRAL